MELVRFLKSCRLGYSAADRTVSKSSSLLYNLIYMLYIFSCVYLSSTQWQVKSAIKIIKSQIFSLCLDNFETYEWVKYVA